MGLNPGGLFGIDSDAVMRQFKEQTATTFPLARTTDNSYSRFRNSGDRAISPFPLDVVVDRNGKIRYISREYDPEALRVVIERALNE